MSDTSHFTITNFRPNGKEISSSEYIKKAHGPLLMHKSHGLGSGIYGVITTTDKMRSILEVHERKYELQSDFELHKPLILDTNEKQASFIEMSTYLMDLCEARINKKKEDYVKLSASFKKFKLIREHMFPNSETINDSVKQFIKDYNSAKIGDFLRQPINYFLESGYDGIYNSSDDGNSFYRGSVIFIHHEPRHQKYAFNPPITIQPGNKLMENRSVLREKRGFNDTNGDDTTCDDTTCDESPTKRPRNVGSKKKKRNKTKKKKYKSKSKSKSKTKSKSKKKSKKKSRKSNN